MKDNLHFNSKEKLQFGIKKVAQAVGVTLGTSGSNVIIEAQESPGHIMTNDGFSIANSIVLADPIEDMGRKILLESINRANKMSGDGSSTTCVLTAALINYGEKHRREAPPMDIKRELEECLPFIEASLKQQTKYIVEDGVMDASLLQQAASIAAEDEEIGATIAKIYSEIGPTGVVYWDVSKTAEDKYEIGTGITVEGASYVSPYMCDATESGQSTNQIRIKKPPIIITKQRISSAAEFDKIGGELFNSGIKDLIVFCDDYDPLVNNDIIKTRMARGFRVILIKMPTLWKDWWYEDLAKVTGATIINSEAGLPISDLTVKHLGTVGNILVTKDDTLIDGIADISQHIKDLEAKDDEEQALRAARLNTATARYFVGARSESALSYRRLKVEDAIGSAYQALQGGIVAGGGIALFNCIKDIPETVGGKILQQALKEPLHLIIINSGLSLDKIEMSKLGGQLGLDTKTQKIVNMISAGIVDPASVVANCITNAVSVASTVITAPTIVLLPRNV